MELSEIPGIGDKTVSTLAKAGIFTIKELLHTFPRTYRPYHAGTSRSVAVGDWVVLKGTISKVSSRHTGRVSTQSGTLWDTSGSITLRWFNMPYIARSISQDSSYLVKGQITEFGGHKQIVSPSISKLASEQEYKDILLPIYSSKGGTKPWVLRQKIAATLDYVPAEPDPLPRETITKYNLLDYWQAINGVHKPSSGKELERAIYRLSFQELYNLQLDALRSTRSSRRRGIEMNIKQDVLDSFFMSLPFTPTDSQIKAVKEIVKDLQDKHAMYRLLQGEVGSGKTLVAVVAALGAHTAGHRTLLMAPTQILAIQLYENFVKYLEKLGLTISLVTAKSKGQLDADIIVGTQALLGKLDLGNYGLVIIDEQHRFGVEQREQLGHIKKAPHILQMTATPIPRSMAETIFHSLDITRLTDIPKDRLPTKTFLVPEFKRLASYDWIKTEVLNNHNQVFVVVPLIEIAEEQDETPLKSLKELELTLHKHFPNIRIDVMHGKMKEQEKLDHMQLFKSGTTQILVATSMIEVGIDIPEANIIVIEDAERFGLAQLHQLRGRVGRGGKQGYCLLFTNTKNDKSLERLAFFIRESNGEKLAHYDMEHRGPGELFGTIQSGFFNLGLGNMYDENLIEDTYEAARMTLGMDKNTDIP